ncbi:YrdB family protein [Lysinibacillus sp. NPDC097287]|uniref:YrdB family protein n=1 Tax=Lysinibacillus sp. NPDC097287 TaxID=3364144 RepID=UPI00380BBFF3
MALNLAYRFLLELCVLATLAYWGLQVGKGYGFKLLLGIGAPVFIAIIWGVFGSPHATIPINGIARFLLELGIFALALMVLFYLGKPALATVFAMLIVINQILLTVFHQR